MPTSYPIPYDGPVGDMLKATNRHPYRPAHLHFLIAAEGYETLITHLFVDADQYLDSDAVFGVTDQISVLHFGEILETGRPEHIRGSPRVQQIYLGTG